MTILITVSVILALFLGTIWSLLRASDTDD